MKKIDKIFENSKSMSLDLYLEKVLYDKNLVITKKKILLELRVTT